KAACAAPLNDRTSGAYALPYFGIKLGSKLRWGAQDNPPIGLGITPDQCSDDGKLVGEGPHTFILSHSIINNSDKEKSEGYWYLASSAGGIIKVVHNGNHASVLANPDDPVVVAD